MTGMFCTLAGTVLYTSVYSCQNSLTIFLRSLHFLYIIYTSIESIFKKGIRGH